MKPEFDQVNLLPKLFEIFNTMKDMMDNDFELKMDFNGDGYQDVLLFYLFIDENHSKTEKLKEAHSMLEAIYQMLGATNS